MEEASIAHIVTIFVSSYQIEQLNVQLFDLKDQPFQSSLINNYSTQTIRLPKEISCFYCVATCPQHGIEEQFECDFSDNQAENDKLTVTKSFSAFKIKMEAQIITEYRVICEDSSPLKEQAILYTIAAANLKKLEQKIIKKLELDQLAKPILTKSKRTQRRSKELKKSKTNFLLKNPLKENTFFQKIDERTEKKVPSIKNFNDSVISESDNYQELKHRTLAFIAKRGGKHMTHIPITCRRSQSRTSKEEQKEPKKDRDLPEYERLFQAINQSASKAKLMKRRARNTYNSLVEELEKETQRQLQKQRELINNVQRAATHLHLASISHPVSRVTYNATQSTNTSPYKILRSKTFRKKQPT